MDLLELREPEKARNFLAQGLWLQRAQKPDPRAVKPALEWALEIAAHGDLVPAIGFLADLGHMAFNVESGGRLAAGHLDLPGFPQGLLRTYEDYVLGKIAGDFTFERAADALRHYEGREKAQGLAYLVTEFQKRAGFLGAELNPAVLKAMIRDTPDRILQEGWDSLVQDGLSAELKAVYESLTAAARRMAEMLGAEHVFELEHKTVLAEFGQRVALRQVLHTAQLLQNSLPGYKIQPIGGRQVVPTRVLDEDTYPVGGFSSISTKGSVESLLHSQLAYMERDERPDLFDIKFIRDELYYYSRDENQFLRRRRTFVFLLYPDLAAARFKDAGLPYQKIILLLGLIVSVVQRLADWLAEDALAFEIYFLHPKAKDKKEQPHPLEDEKELLQMLLREQIQNGTVAIDDAPAPQAVAEWCARKARRSLVHCLAVGMAPHEFEADDTAVAKLDLGRPEPELTVEHGHLPAYEPDDAFHAWCKCLETVLGLWV